VNSSGRKAISFFGLLALGDAVSYLLSPRRQSAVWLSEKNRVRYNNFFIRLATRPLLTRILSIAELGAGFAMLLVAQRSASKTPAMKLLRKAG
jgi:hypothetical protein